MPFDFSTKSETLEKLNGLVKNALVLPQYRIRAGEWRSSSDSEIKTFSESCEWCGDLLIVRSSALNEDTEQTSNAGKYVSIKNIKGMAELKKAVDEVIASFSSDDPENQVFVQPMLENIALSGVAFTCDPNTGGNYYVVNYDDSSGRADTVTAGHDNELKTWIYDKSGIVAPPARFEKLSALLKELEDISGIDEIDIEFAIDTEDRLFLLQARPLPVRVERSLSLKEQRTTLERVCGKLENCFGPHPYLHGKKTVFGIMPDWNPAEIIGVRPRPLSLSLYKELVTDSIWAYQRDNYGYRNLRSFPLLISLAGLPYIDVRVSFNSFIPGDVEASLADRLVDYYIESLEKCPSLHDKVEFGIIFSCYTFDMSERLDKLRECGFSADDIAALTSSLRKLTNNIIEPETGLWKKDIMKIHILEDRIETIMNSHLDTVSKIYWLIEDCKRYGTLPFAGLARAGFIAIQMLKSLIGAGVISEDEYNRYLRSLNTVSSQMASDLNKLDRDTFIGKYGHLRPGTYDILSPRYDEAPDLYFDWSAKSERPERDYCEEFSLSLQQLEKLKYLLKKHSFNHDILSLFNFFKGAVEGREYAKFVFTKSLSNALKLFADLAADLGFSREDASLSNIGIIHELYSSTADARAKMTESVSAGRRAYELTRHIVMPPLITEPADVCSFEYPVNEPNFITLNSVTAPVVTEDSGRDKFRGAILFIKSADPGYDWIFSHGIGGFVSMYGGVNSHMSIRAGELGIPSVIGAGELLFRKWSSCEILEIDCANRQVNIIR